MIITVRICTKYHTASRKGNFLCPAGAAHSVWSFLFSHISTLSAYELEHSGGQDTEEKDGTHTHVDHAVFSETNRRVRVC